MRSRAPDWLRRRRSLRRWCVGQWAVVGSELEAAAPGRLPRSPSLPGSSQCLGQGDQSARTGPRPARPAPLQADFPFAAHIYTYQLETASLQDSSRRRRVVLLCCAWRSARPPRVVCVGLGFPSVRRGAACSHYSVPRHYYTTSRSTECGAPRRCSPCGSRQASTASRQVHSSVQRNTPLHARTRPASTPPFPHTRHQPTTITTRARAYVKAGPPAAPPDLSPVCFSGRRQQSTMQPSVVSSASLSAG